MQDRTFSETIAGNFLENWTTVSEVGKPIIAAVNGQANDLF